MRHVRHETYLLARRINESKAALRVQHCQRQPRKSRASTDVRDGRPLKVCLDGQTIEQMMRDHLLALGNGSQVIGAVPSLELIQELLQTRGVVLGQSDTHTLCVVNESV